MSGKIVEYKMLTSTDPKLLDAYVNRAIGAGWKLYGTPFAIGSLVVAQSVVREEYHSNKEGKK